MTTPLIIALPVLMFSFFYQISITPQVAQQITLPQPSFVHSVPLVQALMDRKSIREFMPTPLTIEDLSLILWSAQGITHSGMYRTAPSAGALYPVDIYLLAGEVTGLESGFYQYLSHDHVLIRVKKTDLRESLMQAAINQKSISKAPVVLVLTGVMERSRPKYDERAERYVYIESGHIAQNIALQVAALNLGTLDIGAFNDARVKSALDLPAGTEPILLLPIGKPQD